LRYLLPSSSFDIPDRTLIVSQTKLPIDENLQNTPNVAEDSDKAVKSIVKSLAEVIRANLKAAVGSYTGSGSKDNERRLNYLLKLLQEISILVIKCMYIMCMGCGFLINIKFDDIIITIKNTRVYQRKQN
jgi:hypothetical protein